MLFRSAPGSTLHEVVASTAAAFEIDGSDPVKLTGRSVIIVGPVEEVSDPAELRRIDELDLETWAPGSRDTGSGSALSRRLVGASFAGLGWTIACSCSEMANGRLALGAGLPRA